MNLKEKEKVKINLLRDKKNKLFFNVSIYNKYNYKQYILKNNLLYTFFIIINFLNKYGLFKVNNVYL